MGKGKTSQKKGKKGGKGKAIVPNLLKVTGDLPEDRVNILLFGFPNDYNNPEVEENNCPSTNYSNSIVHKKRQMAPQTKIFSNMIEERAASPLVSPRYGLRYTETTIPRKRTISIPYTHTRLLSLY